MSISYDGGQPLPTNIKANRFHSTEAAFVVMYRRLNFLLISDLGLTLGSLL